MEVATTNNHHHHAHHQHHSSQVNQHNHNHHHHHRHHHHNSHQPHATQNQSPLLQRMPQQQQQQEKQHQQHQQQKPHNLSLVSDSDHGNNTTTTTVADDLAVVLGHGHGNKSSTAAPPPRSPFQREVREWQRIDPDTGALLSGRLEADRWINGPLNSYGKKSNSGLSSNSSSSSLNDYTAPAAKHTHNNAGKISLHAIVGNNNSNSIIETKSATARAATMKAASASATGTATATATTTTMPSTTATTWQPNQHQHQHQHQHQQQQQQQQQQSHSQRNSRLFEQVALYGQNNSSSNSSSAARVGVADCDDCISAEAHDLLRPATLRQATTPTQRQRDLESFRHYALPTSATPSLPLSSKYAAAATTAATAAAAAAGDDDDVIAAATATAINDDDDDDLRLSNRQLRRQQQPFGNQHATLLHRSRSISNDDLSSEWQHSPDNCANTNDELTATDWRRVSKLRRSFQSTTSNSNTTSTPSKDSFQHTLTTTSSRSRSRPRPLELPTHSTLRSVSQIRAELEAGRRLNTAMRNNHVDLAALDNILQSNSNRAQKNDADGSKRDSFLTAASLKEIRGKLKKLSDESLYKDDFIAYQQPPVADEQIEVQQSVRKAHTSTPISRAAQRLRQLTPETSPEISTTPKSAFQAVTQRQHADVAANVTSTPTSNFLAQRSAYIGPKHGTHSLESRQKLKDTNSTEWHLRRKSYGFEKMSPPEGKSMFRMDASTDSGLGRSGEQLGNWSPTEGAAAATHSARGTVIHFGAEAARNHNATAAAIAGSTRYRNSPSRLPSAEEDDEDARHKRHSIAVDESQYVRENLRKTSQVHLSGFYEPPGSKSLQLHESNNNSAHSATLFQRSQQQKRVEFCKTEVHFAAESGRVNIVETDGKPPPTNNFRRRRRTTSGPLQSLVTSAGTAATASAVNQNGSVTHFGDEQQTQRHRTIASSVVAYKATLVASSEASQEPTTNVTISVPKLGESHLEGSRSSYASTTSGVDTTDNENDEIAAIRGILKNKPIKPKPYHLGENIDSADALWGVQLKPIATGSAGGTLSAVTRCEHDDSPPMGNDSNKSVAERVRIVEKRREHDNVNSYSTKINLSMDDTARDWSSEADLPNSNVMSIELHSPQTPLEKRNSFKRTQSPPIAKPRTIAKIKSSEHPQVHTTTTVKQNTDRYPTTAESIKDSLKIVKEARGARKLREHELSYFGVANAKHEEQISKYPPITTNTLSSTKRTLPSRKLHDEPSTHAAETKHMTEGKAQTTTKWQLLNDKPDLLRHSPIAVEPQMIRRNADLQTRAENFDDINEDDDDDDDDDDEHYYENITNEITPVFKVKTPTVGTKTTTTTTKSYDRRRDLERDALILSEMNKSANQTMKALSDEAALKDQRRRSLHRRNSKPLETIDEKSIAEKINDTCIAVKVARSTYASDAKRTTRHVTPSPTQRVRTSSQSSVESCPRARSRSLSSEREYENISRPKPTRSVSAAKGERKPSTKSSAQQHRSSSRESQRSARVQYSSGDEVGKRDEQQRMRTKSKRLGGSSSNTSNSNSHNHSKDCAERRERQHQHQQNNSKERERERHSQTTASSTAHASQREERVECIDAPSHTHAHSHPERTSSGRRKREEHTQHSTGSMRHSSSRSAAGAEKSEKKQERTGSAGARLLRSLRGHDHDAAGTQQRSHNHRASDREKSERQREREREREREHEREKNKDSRTRGHSSHNTTHSSVQHSTHNNNNSSSKTTATPTPTTHNHSNEPRATRAIAPTTPKAQSRDRTKSSSNTTTATTTTSSSKTHTTHSKNTQNINAAAAASKTKHPQQQHQRHYHDAADNGQSKSHEKMRVTSATTTKSREHSTKQKRKLF